MPTGSHAACSACKHPLGAKIDTEIRAGATLKSISDKYGLSIAGVSRHRKNHMTRRFPGPQPAGSQIGAAFSTKQNLEALLQVSVEQMRQANRSGSGSVVVNAIRETREIMTALDKMEERHGLLRTARESIELAFTMMALVPMAHIRHLADNELAGHHDCRCDDCRKIGELSKHDLTKIRDTLSDALDNPDRWKADGNFHSGFDAVLGDAQPIATA